MVGPQEVSEKFLWGGWVGWVGWVGGLLENRVYLSPFFSLKVSLSFIDTGDDTDIDTGDDTDIDTGDDTGY